MIDGYPLPKLVYNRATGEWTLTANLAGMNALMMAAGIWGDDTRHRDRERSEWLVELSERFERACCYLDDTGGWD